MSTSNLNLFPFCTQCLAVQTNGTWFKQDSKAAETAEKLSVCGRCHIARYCSRECQKQHWSHHKVGCVSSNRVISPQQVDKIVKKVCELRTGKVVIYLDSENKFLSKKKSLEVNEKNKLNVDVVINDHEPLQFTYLLCSQRSFDWEQKLNKILNPPNGIHNPGAMVELGHEMIQKGFHKEAFQMMAERTPRYYEEILQDMFFRKAVTLMHSQKVDIELIRSCAKLLGKNSAEVEVLVRPPEKMELPKELQTKIKEAEKLSYGKRDLCMVDLAQQVIDLGFYDKAFDLVFNWVAIDAPKIIFFRSAAIKIIENGVSHEKLVQLAKSINLTEARILNEVVGIYTQNDQIDFACELAQKSDRSDYYLEIIFSALLNKGRKDEAKNILALVSTAKKRDLEFLLR